MSIRNLLVKKRNKIDFFIRKKCINSRVIFLVYTSLQFNHQNQFKLQIHKTIKVQSCNSQAYWSF